jgi:sucrose phosphorylase
LQQKAVTRHDTNMSIDKLQQRLTQHLSLIYPDQNTEELAQKIITTFFPDKNYQDVDDIHTHEANPNARWSEQTSMLITYGDSLMKAGESPLKTLQHFLKTYVEDKISSVHILPFFPYSSDDGFAVKDYYKVREDLGNWSDVQAIGYDYQLMSDLVINHASSQGTWFQEALAANDDYADFFATACPSDDLSAVVRPRPSPLLTPYQDSSGTTQHFWCTFGPDQVDLNFANPDVLIAFVDIMRVYLENQVRIFRLDAVAFLWKEIGTTCMHLPQTHEIIRLIRTLIDFYPDNVLIITETNVPNHENLTYFGNGNEAHLIYNFSLPPLLVQALITGNEYYLKKWLMRMPPTAEGCAYLNFVASHDGIGLRPAAGILLEEDFDEMIQTMRNFGGDISMRSAGNGEEQPYEINIALFDALKGTIRGPDEYQRERFLASQAIMMALEGVPAMYIHSLLATPNDTEKYKKTNHKRSLNRHQWDYEALEELLRAPDSPQHYVFNQMLRMLSIRKQQAAFHPNATQFTLHLPEGFFGFWRQSLDRTQDIFCITNLTDQDLELPLHQLNLHSGADWYDLLGEQHFSQDDMEHDLIIRPYQSLWITNRH